MAKYYSKTIVPMLLEDLTQRGKILIRINSMNYNNAHPNG